MCSGKRTNHFGRIIFFMKRILILGASILQLPAIQKAKELGYFVGVADQDPQAIGIAQADKFFKVSTIDETGVLDCAKEFQIGRAHV